MQKYKLIMKYQIFDIYFVLIETALMTMTILNVLHSPHHLVFTYLATVSKINEKSYTINRPRFKKVRRLL
jgi:hypothetical protein